jgi:hypothetical protein
LVCTYLLPHNRDNTSDDCRYAFPPKDKTLKRITYVNKLKEICPILEVLTGLPDISEMTNISGVSHGLLVGQTCTSDNYLNYRTTYFPDSRRFGEGDIEF